MSAPLTHPVNGHKLPNLQAVFAERCAARALLVNNGVISLHQAVDELQAYAEQSGLIDLIGQDATQDIMAYAFCAVDFLPEADEKTGSDEEPVYDDAADIVRRWELADPRDGWKNTGEPPPPKAVRNSDISGTPTRQPRSHTPQSTIDAFKYIVRLNEVERLREWLADHPKDAPFLLALLESPAS
jgi:hypothetical protein